MNLTPAGLEWWWIAVVEARHSAKKSTKRRRCFMVACVELLEDGRTSRTWGGIGGWWAECGR